MAKNDLIVVVTSVGTEDQALDVAHALVRAAELLRGLGQTAVHELPASNRLA